MRNKVVLGLTLLSLFGCAGAQVTPNEPLKMLTQTSTQNRGVASTFANKSFYNGGFDTQVAKQLDQDRLCRCNDSNLKNRIGVLGATNNAPTQTSTFEYKLECGVRTSSERSGREELITAVPCTSFDVL